VVIELAGEWVCQQLSLMMARYPWLRQQMQFNRLKRREFITLLGGAAAWPLAARAQQPAMPVVGFLRDSTAAGSEFIVNALRKGLAEAGFVEGRNLTIEYAWTDGRSERLSALAAALVGRHVAVIVSSALSATYVAQTATSTIPVVFAVNSDPVASKLVASLSRPGGNLTGVAYLTSELGGKRLGLMHEMVPKVADFALLAHPTYPSSAPFISDVKAAARSMGLRIEVFNASTESEIDTAFAALSARRLGALLIANYPLFTTRRERVIALAARYAVPTMYVQREFASAGGLITYGTDLTEVYRLTGGYAGRILKGDKPADLPVLPADQVRDDHKPQDGEGARPRRAG
jgi:putative tryptophan/tyrosine transport system substrate-binding protein